MVRLLSRRGCRGTASLRVLALVGTALSGIATSAQAEKLVFNGTGDFSVARADTLADTAPVVDVRTTNGNLNLNFGDLNVTNNGGGRRAGLFGQVTGAGNVAITTRALTVTDASETYGIEARATTGSIAIDAAKTSGSAAIIAGSTTGAITVKSGTATGTNGTFTRLVTPPPTNDPFAGVAPSGSAPFTITNILGGIDARSISGAIAVNADATSAAGVNQSAIVALSNGDINVSSQSATSGSQFGIFAGAYTEFEPNLFFSNLGNNNVTVSSAVASTSGSSYAIFGQGGTVKITSGTATQSTGVNQSFGAAIGAQAGAGGITLTSGTATSNSFSGHAIVLTSLGTATIDSGTINTTNGNGSSSIAGGLSVAASGATSIKSNTINLVGTGFGIAALSGNAPLSIDSNIIAAPAGSGVSATTFGGAIVVKSDTITAKTGINANANLLGLTAGAVTVTSKSLTAANGSGIFTSGGITSIDSTSVSSHNGTAIGAFGTGGLSIKSGTASATGAQGSTAITAFLNQTGRLAITSTTATASSEVTAFLAFSRAISATATGSADIVINSGTATASAGAKGGTVNAIEAISSSGAISITSGTATATGGFGTNFGFTSGTSRGISATSTSGTITIAAQTSSGETGGIHATSSGSISVTAGTTSAATGTGVFVSSAKLATVDAANTTAGGNGFSAVNVTGGTGVKLTVGNAASSGDTLANPFPGTAPSRADAVLATAATGAVDATIGSAKATGAGADAVRLIANGMGGAVTATITGTLSSLGGHGLFIDPPGKATVTFAKGADVSGGLAGLNVESATGNMIDNAGRIAKAGSTVGAAIIAAGKTSLVNSGTIAGVGTTAVQLGATDDSVTLQTGSVVQGAIDGSGGTDIANLSGTINTATATQTMARFTNFETLNVNGGYWTASEPASSFNSVSIASGASLEIAPSGAGFTGIAAPSIVDNGTLVLRSSAGSSASFGATAISGSGSLVLTGNGTLNVDNGNITTTGATVIGGGSTLLLTGTLSNPVNTVAGGTFQLGNGGTTGSFTGNLVNDGAFVVDRSDAVALTGAVSGSGAIIKRGAGSLSFNGTYSATGTLSVLEGSLRLPSLASTAALDLASGQLDLSGAPQTIAGLSGAATGATLNIGAGMLTVNQGASSNFAGGIAGTGGLTKTGAGTLTLSGASTYTGPTNVNGGTLAVNGRIASPVTVGAGGRLGGIGTVASITAAAQGTVAPGNSIGTLNIAGPVTFAAGSTFEVEVNADGRSDQIVATRPATLAGTVAVVAEPGSFGKVTDYTILTASAVTGQFTGTTTSSATLVPFLTYTPTGVRLTLARSDLSFAGIATTANQRAVADAIEARGLGNAVFDSVIRLPTEAAGQAAFDALSGELYASLPTALVDQSRIVRSALLDRSAASGLEGAGVWGQAFDSSADGNGGRGVAEVDTDRRGVIAGADLGGDGWRVGAAAGVIDGHIDADTRASTANVETKLVGVYGRASLGRLTASAGGSYEWHDIDASRTVGTAGLAGGQTAGFDGSSRQLFAELAYALMTGPIEVSPFVGVATVRSKTDGFAETGTAAALTVAGQEREVSFGTLGLRIGGFAELGTSARLLPRFSIAYRQAWGDRTGTSSAGFAGAPAGFTVTGARLGSSGVDLDGGVEIGIGQRVRLGASYMASSAGDWSDHGAKITASFAF